MKLLFFLIAIANIALFMWEYKSGAFDPLPKTMQQAGLENQEKMVLVSELPPPPVITTLAKIAQTPPRVEKSSTENTLPAVAEKTVAVEKFNHCYEVGPFATKKIYNAWLAETKTIQKTIRATLKTAQTATGYLVYYPIAATSISPQAATQLLNDRGVTDFYLLRNGEHKGQLSLGLFSTEERAKNLQRAMQAKGVQVEVKPRYKTTAQQYAFVKSSVVLLESAAALKKIAPDVHIKAIVNASKGCQ